MSEIFTGAWAGDTRLVESVTELAHEFAGRAAGHDRDGSFPFENFARLRTAGLLDLMVPREYGGHGAGLAAACGVISEIARGDASTALVGTPEQVAESLLAYYDLGVTTFLIRGFDPLEDAIDYGRELIPLVRRETARQETNTTVKWSAAG